MEKTKITNTWENWNRTPTNKQTWKAKKEYHRRTRKHLESKLCSINLIKGIKTWTIRYSRPFFKYMVHSISFQTFFIQAFKFVVDSWTSSMLLLYILWDDWPTFRISASNEQLQKELLQLVNFKNAIWTWGHFEERYAIKFCFKLGKNATETHGKLPTAFGPSCMNQSSVFECHKRFKEGRESVRVDERCRRSKEVNTLELIG